MRPSCSEHCGDTRSSTCRGVAVKVEVDLPYRCRARVQGEGLCLVNGCVCHLRLAYGQQQQRLRQRWRQQVQRQQVRRQRQQLLSVWGGVGSQSDTIPCLLPPCNSLFRMNANQAGVSAFLQMLHTLQHRTPLPRPCSSSV